MPKSRVAFAVSKYCAKATFGPVADDALLASFRPTWKRYKSYVYLLSGRYRCAPIPSQYVMCNCPLKGVYEDEL